MAAEYLNQDIINAIRGLYQGPNRVTDDSVKKEIGEVVSKLEKTLTVEDLSSKAELEVIKSQLQGMLTVQDANALAELEAVKTKLEAIETRLNEPLDTKLTGSKVTQILTKNIVTIAPGATYIVDDFDVDSLPFSSVIYSFVGAVIDRPATIVFRSSIEQEVWDGTRTNQFISQEYNTIDGIESGVIWDYAHQDYDAGSRISMVTKKLIPLGKFVRVEIKNNHSSLDIAFNRGIVRTGFFGGVK